MQLYPAIDMKSGQCVRLRQGDYDAVTVYSEDPLAIAKKWQEMGASYLHLVDLDGAKMGCGVNDRLIQEVVQAVEIPVQVGGGIRSLGDIKEKLELGVARVILGSAAVKNRQLVQDAILQFGADRIVIGVDAKNGCVAIEGWQEVTELSALSFAEEMRAIGVTTMIYTDIAKDGMLCGPNIEETACLIQGAGVDVIASGGVQTLQDLKKLQAIGVQGSIVGKALYTGAIHLEEAVRIFEKGDL
ncbi:MAG: 1-(5-phosphoribosyl)-5-[(5-phosphoribosylamino)methylideneamino]imidazole-4-carboxamide isomerase [Cellulosilyticaceae bacterium]